MNLRDFRAAMGLPPITRVVYGKDSRGKRIHNPKNHYWHNRHCADCGEPCSDTATRCKPCSVKGRWCNGHFRSAAYRKAHARGLVEKHGHPSPGVHFLETRKVWRAGLHVRRIAWCDTQQEAEAAYSAYMEHFKQSGEYMRHCSRRLLQRMGIEGQPFAIEQGTNKL